MSATATASTVLTSGVQGRLVTGTEVAITARQHEFTVDEPESLGGADKGANPIEHLLAALASCTVISYQVWAGKLGIAVDSIDVDLEGTIDLAGFFGTDETVRPGFQGIELGIRVAGPASEADYRRLEQAVAEHCPVLDNLTHGVPVTTNLEVAPAAA